MTHVTKFNEENFLKWGGSPVKSLHNGFDTVRCANQRNVRATVSKQATVTRHANRIDGVFHRYRVKDFHAVDVEDHVAVITPWRYSDPPPSFTSWRATALRAIGITSTGSGNLPRISTCLEALAEQRTFLNRSNDFFTGQRRTAAFDHLHVAVDLTAHHLHVKGRPLRLDQTRAEAFQFFSGSI